MRSTRRQFLVQTALAGTLPLALPAAAAPIAGDTSEAGGKAEKHSPPMDAMLRAYVDVLIPGDETPSASSLGVDKQLLATGKRISDYQRLLDFGLAWINQQARASFGRDFTLLADGEKDGVVARAARAGHDSLERRFFERTRADAFFHYYGRPESWRGIVDYRGPPQPLGYMDYVRAPR